MEISGEKGWNEWEKAADGVLLGIDSTAILSVITRCGRLEMEDDVVDERKNPKGCCNSEVRRAPRISSPFPFRKKIANGGNGWGEEAER